MSEQDERFSGFEIAVVGIACRFPGANGPDEFWQNLKNGVESIRRFSDQELIDLGHDPDLVAQSNFVPAHGVVDNYNMFDNQFFGYTPREAGVMDPQQRLFLELCWEGLEHAGYAPKSMQVPVGIFAGTSTNTYLEANVRKNKKVLAAISDFQANVLNQNDFLSTRASYKLGLSGPSFTVQSACSTSLLATHLACQQLIAGACDVALAGGVSITLPENWGYQYQEGMIYSPDGHCHAFDADANGTLKGDGGGIVVLKRLADAIEDGDHIEAIILGSACNNDAQAKVGYTAPGLDGQVDVIQTAMLMADVTADSITNIECHGTGTPMGDPIEIAALTKAFADDAVKQSCAVGSVKTNIGHLDAGAGVAGLIKTVLALKHKTLPPSLNYQRPNPIIEFEKTPFYVNHQCTPWQSSSTPRRGGVSSFGIGGTNAHIIVEETPEELCHSTHDTTSKSILLCWSAKSKTSLDQYTDKMIALLASDTSPVIEDIAFTLNHGREKFAFKRALICTSKQDALTKLREEKPVSVVTTQCDDESAGNVFMFPGQGSQYVDMARNLYNDEPVFKQQVDLCAELLVLHLQFDIRQVLYPNNKQQQLDHAEKLQQTACTQPALFVIQYALAKLWMHNEIHPSVLIGHSIGEYAAACIAGVFSLEDALLLVAKRGELMQALPPGDMLSVQLSATEISTFLDDFLSIAAINSPSLCVVSGPSENIERLAATLGEKDIICKQLKTSHGFHSAMMDPMLAAYEAILDACTLMAPTISIMSTVTGGVIDPKQISSKQYWLDNIRSSVNFSDAAQALINQNKYTYIECGPGNTLSSLLRSCSPKPAEVHCVSSLRHPMENISDTIIFEAAQAKLHTCKAVIKSSLIVDVGNRVVLPTYAFQRAKCWVSPVIETSQKLETVRAENNDIKQAFDKWFYSPSWQSAPSSALSVEPKNESWLLLSSQADLTQSLANELKAQCASLVTTVDYCDLNTWSKTQTQNNVSPDLKVTHIVIVDEIEVDDNNDMAPNSAQFYALLDVLQSLLPLLDFTQIKLSYLTSKACAIGATSMIAPQRLMPLGLLRSLESEYVGLKTRFINLADDKPISAPNLLNEMRFNDDGFVVNFEYGNRWVQTLQPLPVAHSNSLGKTFKLGATYLITGGLGSMGLAFAKHLVLNFQANLILLSRTLLPEGNAAHLWLDEHDENDATSKQLKAVSELRTLGTGTIIVLAADVSDLDAMKEVKQHIDSRFGGVQGIIHSAGTPGGGIVANLNKEVIEPVFSSKVQGTWVLGHIFAAQPLDFMILCSSLTSFINRPGRAEYAAANYYLDAIASQSLAVNGTPTISINWDAWTNSSMSQSANVPSAENRIDTQQGVDALLRCLQFNKHQVVVSTRNLMPNYDFETGVSSVSNDKSVKMSGVLTDESDDINDVIDTNLSPAQRVLFVIWQDLLGVEDLSIQDNFFELGGDSIVSLQMTSRAAQQGLKISARQIFENQTIFDLAAVVEDQFSLQDSPSTAAQTPLQELEIVTGELPLTPIQRWFFECNFVNSQHWNLFQTLALPPKIEPQNLLKILDTMLQQHDMLRTQFTHSSNGWQQEIKEFSPLLEADLVTIDVSQWGEHEYQLNVEELANNLSSQFELDSACLYRFVHLNGTDKAPSELLIIIHHLLVDIVSFNILIDEMQSAWAQISSGQAIQIIGKSASFIQWSNALSSFAEKQECGLQQQYWQYFNGLNLLPLPKDDVNGINNVASAQQLIISLSQSATATITKELVKDNIQPKDILLCALVMTLNEYSGQSRLLVELEEHGRDALDENIDVARTFGWFTKAFPVICDAPTRNNPAAAIKYISELAAYASENGLGYGLLGQSTRHLDSGHKGVLELPKSEVVFLYLGNVSQKQQISDFAPTSVCRASRHPTQLRTHTFEFSIWVEQGKMQISLGFSQNCHQAKNMEALLHKYKSTVESMASDLLVSKKSISSSLPKFEGNPANANINVSEKELMPLSFAQERVWFLEQIEEQSTLHNKHMVLEINGEMSSEYLRNAVEAIIAKHQSLRTCFVKSAGEPKQIILENIQIDLPSVQIDKHLDGHSEASVQERLAMLSQQEIDRPFDLQNGPLLRFKLLAKDPTNHFLLITIHHIVTDAWSMQLFIKQLELAYTQLSNEMSGSQILSTESNSQYVDFVTWQHASMNTPQVSESLNFWRNKLAGIPARLVLPTDRQRPSLQTFEGDKVNLSLSSGLISKMRDFCVTNGVSVNMTMLTVFKVLLAKYSGQTDIVVGTPVANRSKREFESIIGLLVNNLVLRSDVNGNKTCSQLLSHVRGEVLDANEHADVPFEKVVQAINPERDRSQSPLFQVMMVFMNAPQANSQDPSTIEVKHAVTMQPTEIHNRISEFDLSLYVYEKGTQQLDSEVSLNAWIEFNTSLFNRARIEQFSLHYCYLLEQVIGDKDLKINQLQLLSYVEQEQLLTSAQQQNVMALKDSTGTAIELENLLTEKLKQSTHKKALRCADASISYAQLEQMSASLARQLQGLGVGPNTPVAIYLDRSINMLVAMLAILRAGGCYVPLDPSFPAQRIDYMLRNSETQLLLSNKLLSTNITDCPCEVLLLDDWHLEDADPIAIECRAKPTDLAYMIYTSGSTGLPKGVRIERRNVVNFLMSMADKPGLQESDIFVAVTTISFDIHVLELWLPLVAGAQLVIADSQQTADGSALLHLLQTTKATGMQATPATWQLLLQCGWDSPLALEAFCGGEVLTKALCEKLLPLTQCVWNMYGPTETCVWSSVKKIQQNDPTITIGKPIHNTQFYIVDKDNNLLPAGIPGELLIGGEGVVRDYYKLDELTAKQFVDNPIAKVKTGRVYRTGDTAILLDNGEFVVVGRFDNQIKLRGYRIELGEIEGRLREHRDVHDAVVGIRGEDENKKLVAWLRSSKNAIPSNQDLRAFLIESLPAYMVPAVFVWLDEFAKTPNNKIDRKALVEPAVEEIQQGTNDLSQTDAERLLAGIFASVLNTPSVGRFDNFFDLGGHSLLSMKVVDRIEAETGVKVHPGELFQQSVGQIAAMYEDKFSASKEQHTNE